MFNQHKLLLTFLAVLPFASLASETNRWISTAEEMSALYDVYPSHSWAFSLTGTVTWCSTEYGFLVLKDETGNCSLFNIKDKWVRRGDKVEARGFAHVNSRRDPWIDEISLAKLGFEPLPEPEKKTLEECLVSTPPLEGVRTEATVVDVCEDEFDRQCDWLILKDGASMLSAVCSHSPENKQLIDARIEVTGPVCTHVFGQRKFVSPFINTEFGGSVRVVSAPAGDHFDFPQLSPSRFTTPADIERLGKRSAVGKVVAAWPPNNCLLLTPDERYVRLVLAANETLPRCGSLVKAAGYPSTDIFTVWLTLAKVRPEEMADIPEGAAEEIQARMLFPNAGKDREKLECNLDNRLVAMRGLVKNLESHNDGTLRVILDSDGTVVPVDFSARPDDFWKIAVGSTIKVTGRCILANERWNPNNAFPRITAPLIAISAKPEVIRGPGWWTVGKLLTVIAILLVALVVAAFRSYLARRIAKLKLNERTQLAVEIHDSLSQALTGLACQITAAQDSLTTDIKNTEDKLATASQMLMSCRTELRNCLFDLRNDTIGEKNFNKAIIKTIEPFESSAAITVRFQVNRALFEDTTVHAILAVIRELVSNAVRHGNAWTIKIAGVTEGKTLLFSVTDDGSGFDFEHRKNSDEGHFGIDGIRERLARLDGSISYEAPPSGGTKAVVRIPIRHS